MITIATNFDSKLKSFQNKEIRVNYTKLENDTEEIVISSKPLKRRFSFIVFKSESQVAIYSDKLFELNKEQQLNKWHPKELLFAKDMLFKLKGVYETEYVGYQVHINERKLSRMIEKAEIISPEETKEAKKKVRKNLNLAPIKNLIPFLIPTIIILVITFNVWILEIEPWTVALGVFLIFPLIVYPTRSISFYIRSLSIAFSEKRNMLTLIDEVCQWAKSSRMNGIIALDDYRNHVENPKIHKILGLVVDSVDNKDVRETGNNELKELKKHHISLLNFVLLLGFSILVSFVSVSIIEQNLHPIWIGLSILSFIIFPFYVQLKNRLTNEVSYLEIAFEGIYYIQVQESPILLRKRLNSMLNEEDKRTLSLMSN